LHLFVNVGALKAVPTINIEIQLNLVNSLLDIELLELLLCYITLHWGYL